VDRHDAALMGLVEREGALRLLTGLFGEAVDGSGRLLLVSGEAGVGKTALVREFVAGLGSDVRVLVGACDPVVTPRPLAPLVDIAGAVGGELARLLELGSGSGLVFDALLRALAGGREPTIVVLEDVHWADEATLDLLCVLGRRVGVLTAMVVVTFRDDDLAVEHPLRSALGNLPSAPTVRRLPLSPLSETGVAELVAGRRLDVRKLHRVTGGNPFFLTELLATRSEELPVTVRDAVLARAALLSAEGRAALEGVAAFGRPVEEGLAERLGVDAEAVDECVSRGLLRWAGSSVEFRHELARSAVLAVLPRGRAVRLHCRILATLQSEEGTREPAELAWHAEEAGDAAAVLAYAPAAAVEAERLGAHREAAAQYARALRFADSLPAERRAELAGACSREAALGGRVGDAIAAARVALAARRELDDEFAIGDALTRLAALVWHTADRREAVSLAEEAVALLEGLGPSTELASAYATRAALHAQAAEMADAAALAARALALADRLDLSEVRIRALGTLGAAKLCGPNEDGWPELEQSLQYSHAAGLTAQTASAYGRIVWFGAMHRQFDRLERHFDDALAFCEAHELDGARSAMLQSRCVELVHRGRWSEAGELAQELLADPGASPVDRIEPLYVLGRLRARRGDPDAWSALDEALELSAPRGELQHVGNVRAVRAEAAWLEGDRKRMVAEAEAAYALAVPVGDPWILGELALWLWRGDALDTLEPVLASHPYGLQISGDWAAAAAGWDRLGCPFETAAALLDSDEDPALRRALLIFDGLGARPAVAMTMRKLRAAGVRGVPRGPQPATRAHPSGLTRRQQEVLDLLAAGLTDAEIADRLFLATRTVNHHVSAILAKLEVRSRTEAAARVK
jgi:DNA-binding CsgD family transcriptional regulator